MRVLLSGSTGLLGTALAEALESEGHSIVRLARPESAHLGVASSRAQIVRWNSVTGELDGAAAEGCDALVHLAGASIADGRWSAPRKNLLRTSRVEATRQLVSALSRLRRPPQVVVSASAVGFYGNRGDEILSENSGPGSDFLAVVCSDWESETQRATQFGARTVMLRFGIILAANGGALPRMALPFKFGVGGRLGTGRQWMSWLALSEAVAMIRFAIATSKLQGPANAVSPTPIQNIDFTRVLAKTLRRPAIFPAPALALRLALGEMADALLLASQRVIPERLAQTGFAFATPDLATTLRELFQDSN